MLKAIKLFIVSNIIFLGLTACSTTGTGANTSGTPSDSGVQTSGLGGEGDLSNPNAMVPGANQRYFFDYDKSDIHASDLPSIKVQAQYLISHPSANARVEGNTDIRGSREYNIALGQHRAEAVKKTLLLNGAQSNQIQTISYGAEKPIASGNDETSYAQNRRADMIYQSH